MVVRRPAVAVQSPGVLCRLAGAGVLALQQVSNIFSALLSTRGKADGLAR